MTGTVALSAFNLYDGREPLGSEVYPAAEGASASASAVFYSITFKVVEVYFVGAATVYAFATVGR